MYELTADFKRPIWLEATTPRSSLQIATSLGAQFYMLRCILK